MEDGIRRVAAEIDLAAAVSNIREIRALAGNDVKLMAVVKADGYGHGAEQIAKAVDPYVDCYAVATVLEGIKLRRKWITKPILILGYTFPEDLKAVVEYDISQTIFTEEDARMLSETAVKAGKKASVHFALDTGMSRIGFRDDAESAETVVRIAAMPGINAEGIFTHYATADEADLTKALRQRERYHHFVDVLREKGLELPYRHVANSAGIMEMPREDETMVRAGIILYGLYPSSDVHQEKLSLKPVMRYVSHVAYVKTLPAGCEISYGGTYTTTRDTRVATIPVGYADGYPRILSGKGDVLIHGHRCRILGRVCMDQMMVDVTGVPETVAGDLVTLIGRDGAEEITADELAALAGTINYEIVCGISARVPRLYDGAGISDQNR